MAASTNNEAILEEDAMRTTSSVVKMGSTILGLGLAACAAYASFGAAGCTVTTSDGSLDGGETGGDTGVVTDTGTSDTGDAGGDTNLPPDTGAGFAVVIPAASLIGSSVSDDVKDFGGGSTKSDIVTGGRIAYAVATSGSATSAPFGKSATDSSKLVDGRLTGLTVGTSATITVTGYLRGLNGNLAEAPSTPIAWATTTCTATPSATADVTASCTKLKLLSTLKGILFSADVLPDGYCIGKGATDFSLTRARQPFSGPATVSKTTNDCLGVIWVPLSDVTETAGGKSEWSLSLETKGSGTACTLAAPCKVTRGTLDVFVVGNECQLSNTSTGGTCF